MQLTPDSLRQWYVYFQEKEMGPYRESELSQKLAIKEIALSAYVFTEGMTDWALASDTPVLTMATVRDTPAPAVTVASSAPKASIEKKEEKKLEVLSVSQPNIGSVVEKKEKVAEKSVEKNTSGSWERPSFSESGMESSSVNASQVRSLSAQKTQKGDRKDKEGLQEENTRAATRRFTLSTFKFPKLKPSVYAIPLILLTSIGGGYYYATNVGYIPYVSDFLGVVLGKSVKAPKSKKVAKKIEEAPPPVQTPEVVEEKAVQSSESSGTKSRDVNWDELQSFRKNQDPKAPPYRLASATLGSDRPVLIGVVSPLLRGTFVRVAVFPQSDRNLMAIPRLWEFRVPVADGYFAVGPLTIDGGKLPPGRYNVLVQMGQSYLGDTSFEVGTWPTGSDLTSRQSQLQKEKMALAEKERSAIEAKMREVSAAIGQLKVYGRYAGQGVKGAKDWKKLSKPWKDAFMKALQYQRSVVAGPMFYAKIQNDIYVLMGQLLRVYEALDTQSTGGAKEVQKKYKKGIAQIWTDLAKDQNNVSGEIQILGQKALPSLQIDMNVVKAQLGKNKE